MSLDAHHVEAQQVAAALATAAQMVRRNLVSMATVDATLVSAITPLADQLDTAVNALGKYAWAPAPVPPVSAAAGGG